MIETILFTKTSGCGLSNRAQGDLISGSKNAQRRSLVLSKTERTDNPSRLLLLLVEQVRTVLVDIGQIRCPGWFNCLEVIMRCPTGEIRRTQGDKDRLQTF